MLCASLVPRPAKKMRWGGAITLDTFLTYIPRQNRDMKQLQAAGGRASAQTAIAKMHGRPKHLRTPRPNPSFTHFLSSFSAHLAAGVQPALGMMLRPFARCIVDALFEVQRRLRGPTQAKSQLHAYKQVCISTDDGCLGQGRVARTPHVRHDSQIICILDASTKGCSKNPAPKGAGRATASAAAQASHELAERVTKVAADTLRLRRDTVQSLFMAAAPPRPARGHTL